MAEKVLGFRIEVKGTDQQTAQLAKLGGSIDQLKARLKLLNDIQRKGTPLTSKQRKERELLNTQLKANRQNYNALNREILKNNTAVKKNNGFIGGIKKGIKGAATSFLGVTAAIAGVTAVIGGMIKTVIKFEKANSKLQAVLGVTKDEMVGLKDQAKQLGSSTKFTATAVTELQTEFAKLGFPTNEILNMTEATLNGASALGSELAEQAALTGSTLKQFSLDSTDAAKVNDVLAKSASSTALDFSKLSTALPIVGTTAKIAGKSLEETTALLGVLSDRGLDASTSGTALRNVFLELSKKGLTMEEAMAKINTSTDKNATAMELFGKRGATVGVILSESGDEIEKLTGTMEGAAGAAREMARIMEDNLAGDITKAESAWEGFTLALLEGDNALSKMSRNAVSTTSNILNLASALLNGEDAAKSFATAGVDEMIRAGTVSDELIKGMTISQADLLKATNNSEAAVKILGDRLRSEDITQAQFEKGIRKLADGYKILNKEEREAKRIADEKKASDKAKADQAAKAQAEIDAGIQAEAAKEAAAEKSRKKAAKAAKKAADEKLKAEQDAQKARLKAVEDGDAFLLQKTNEFNLTDRELKLQAISDQFDDKINAITEDSAKEIALKQELEVLKREALKAQKLEFETIDKEEQAEKDLEERELFIENELLLAGEDYERRKELLEQRRQLELSDKNLTAEQIKQINIKADKEIQLTEEQQQERKKALRIGDLNAAAGLAGALGDLAAEGSAEAKGFATASALINTYLAISGALANAAKLGPFAVAAQVATASAIGFAQVAKINTTNPSKKEDGGLVDGPSHKYGGVQMYHKSGAHLGEMEGNEYIISAKRTREIGVDKLDAMNFGGNNTAMTGFFQNGGRVPNVGGSSRAADAENRQANLEQLAVIVANEMQQTIIRTPVVNNAVDTFSTAAQVQNQESDLSFG